MNHPKEWELGQCFTKCGARLFYVHVWAFKKTVLSLLYMLETWTDTSNPWLFKYEHLGQGSWVMLLGPTLSQPCTGKCSDMLANIPSPQQPSNLARLEKTNTLVLSKSLKYKRKNKSRMGHLSIPEFIFPLTVHLLGFEEFGVDQGKQ